MGNFIQRLFSGDSSKSTETGCKRPFTKNKVHLHSSKKSPSSHEATQVTSVHENELPRSATPPATSTPPEDQVQTREKSPFQRDFLPSHEPLVSLEKSRPRRSNVRRSARMNQSVGKGDKVERPARNVLSTVPSYIEPDYDEEDTAPNVVSNRADPNVPVSHSNHTSTYWTHAEEEETATEKVESSNQETVDELSPNERHKVATSRISQMFAKREQRQKPTSMMIEPGANLSHANSNNSSSNGGMVLNADYVRVYENIDNYGHYTAAAGDSRHDATEHTTKSTSQSSSRDLSEDDEPKVLTANDDTGESAGDHHHPNQPDESSSPFRPEVVPRRSKHKMMHGNPLLIDELKKRQSTIYQAAD